MKKIKILKNGIDNNDTNIIISLNNDYDVLGTMVSFNGDILSENLMDINYFGYTNINDIIIFYRGEQQIKDNLIDLTMDWGDGNLTSGISFNDMIHHYTSPGRYSLHCHVRLNYGDLFFHKEIKVPFDEPVDTIFTKIILNNGIEVEHSEFYDIDSYKGGQSFRFIGIGKSRLEELKKYGTNDYVGVTRGIYPDGKTWIRYTLDGLEYEDTSDGLTTITGNTSNYQDETIINQMLTRNEHFLGFIDGPNIQSDVNIDRGKQSVIEKNLRLCEINNMGELSVYGNGFFSIKKQ